MTVKLKLISAAMYFALGLLSYMILGDYIAFVWADPWIYVYLAFWPIIWMWYFFLWGVAIAAVIFATLAIMDWWGKRKQSS